jgi:hypothetical protein
MGAGHNPHALGYGLKPWMTREPTNEQRAFFGDRSVNQHSFVPVRANASNAVKPPVVFKNVPVSPVLSTVAGIAARAVERCKLGVHLEQRPCGAGADCGMQGLLTRRRDGPFLAANETLNNDFPCAKLGPGSALAADAAKEVVFCKNLHRLA